MSQQIRAIYENGILRPLTPLNLPENKVVNVVVLRILKGGAESVKDTDKDSAKMKIDKLKQLDKN